MERANMLKLMLFVVFLVLWSRGLSMPIMPPFAPRPLCLSQFALVNHACAMLPFTPGPPPSPPSPPPSPPSPPPSPPSPPSPDGPDRGRGRRHGRRRRPRQESPIEQDCCHWLNAVDNECVCDLLVRLPPFLSRPFHQYIVNVDESCNVTFSCGS